VGALGGYTNTNEGKVIAASFLDNFNKIVVSVRENASLRAGGAVAGVVYNAGDVVRSKIDNVQLLSEPLAGAKEVAKLMKTEELVYLGTEKDGYLQVQGASGSGWVLKVLMLK
jgi:hypothetical protein